MRVRTEAKRAEILDTAASVFLEQGFERASMSEIAGRVGGSKGTLYGYFKSKEELFIAVVMAESDKQLAPLFDELDRQPANLRDALIFIGERAIAYLLTPDAIAALRMVVSEAHRSDIGQRYFERGRHRGIQAMAAYLEAARKAGRLQPCNFEIAAGHLISLMESEWLPSVLFGLARPAPSRREIRESMQRAVDVFLAAYGAHDKARRGN
jgi:AcrR family transcriptional regulator